MELLFCKMIVVASVVADVGTTILAWYELTGISGIAALSEEGQTMDDRPHRVYKHSFLSSTVIINWN